MKFRGILIDPSREYERPQQRLGGHLPAVESWAGEALRSASPEAKVEIYEMQEVLVKSVSKEQP